jgi:hypothetical protein
MASRRFVRRLALAVPRDRDPVCDRRHTPPVLPDTSHPPVRELLDYWQLALPDTTVVERTVLLANELVTNAVVHARTDLRLRLELRGDWLHIAVRDSSPRWLLLVTPQPEAEGGRGLCWSSSLPDPGACTATLTAARSSGAPSSCKARHAPQ